MSLNDDTRKSILIGTSPVFEARIAQLEAALSQQAETIGKLRAALEQARSVLVVACGTDAPYIRIALGAIAAALADSGAEGKRP